MGTLKRYCFTLDLKNDDKLIEEYEAHHKKLWPEVLQSFQDAGIENLEMYRTGIRVVMLFDVNDSFSFEKKDQIDRNNPVIQKWEALMAQYQQALPGALPGEKWVLMKRIFKL
jgi:L-rhamnose mutarotase